MNMGVFFGGGQMVWVSLTFHDALHSRMQFHATATGKTYPYQGYADPTCIPGSDRILVVADFVHTALGAYDHMDSGH